MILNVQPSTISYSNARVMQYLKGKFDNINAYDINHKTLRSYIKIEDQQANLTFRLTNKNKDQNSEHIVDSNDIFIGTQMGLGFISVPKNGKIENYSPIFFPSPKHFNYTATGSSIPQFQCINSIYYGTISIEEGGEKLVTGLDAGRLKRTPISNIEGQYAYQDGRYMDLAQYPIMNGGTTTEVMFKVSSANTESISGDTSKQDLYAVLYMPGFNIEGLSQPYSKAYSAKCHKKLD